MATNQEAIGRAQKCPLCGTPRTAGQVFCSSCGERLCAGASRGSSGGAVKLECRHRKHLTIARYVILAVALLTLVVTLVKYTPVISEIIEALQSSSPMNQDALMRALWIIGVPLIVATIFMILFFWIPLHPFGATLTALVLYITDSVVDLAVIGKIPRGWIGIRIAIILALLDGVRAGLMARRESSA